MGSNHSNDTQDPGSENYETDKKKLTDFREAPINKAYTVVLGEDGKLYFDSRNFVTKN